MIHPARQRGRSVALYVALALITFAAGIAVQIGLSTKQSYDRERARASTALQSVAASQAEDVQLSLAGVPPLLEGLRRNPDITSFDPTRCRRAMASFDGGISGARLTVLDASGRQICSAGDDPVRSARTQPTGPWFAQATRSTGTLWVPPAPDALGAGTVILAATKIAGAHGPGVLLAVLYNNNWVTVPAGQPSDTAVILVDATGGSAFATTPNADVAPDGQIRPGHYANVRAGHGVTTVTETDGRRWIYAAATVPTLGLRVLAGRLRDRAYAPAQAVFHQSLLVGGASLAVLALLGLLFFRVLTRPLRGLAAVVGASAVDDEVRAEPSGPREVVALAERFNTLLDERSEREASLRWRATHDVLTGLPNRYAISELLGTMMDAASEEEDAALLFLDLDRFKLVNDSHGHMVGDEVLRVVATRLAEVLPDGHLLCRFGGDEFVVLSPATSVPQAEELARSLIAAASRPITIDAQELHVGACVGIVAAHPGTPTHELIRDADTAMYRAKASGTGRTAVFDERMHSRAVARVSLETDLRAAFDQGALAVHYQPVIDLHNGQVAGAEALLRWNHPDRGAISPQEFIPVAEQSGLIVPIGRWVMETAARQAATWTRNAGRPIPVAVNVSAVQIGSGDLVGTVRDALVGLDGSPELLELEVTEGSFLEDLDLAEDTLAAVRALGVTVALDDFGTGFSSLAHLRRLPLDVIKIDRSFVAELDVNARSSRIVHAVVSLAAALDMRVIAEGVENQHQLTQLVRFGCSHAQGYLLSRPQPAAALDDLLNTGIVLPPLPRAHTGPPLRRDRHALAPRP